MIKPLNLPMASGKKIQSIVPWLEVKLIWLKLKDNLFIDIESQYFYHNSNLIVDCTAIPSRLNHQKSIWFGGVDLELDGTISFEGEDEEDLKQSASEEDRGFISSLRILVLQFLLWFYRTCYAGSNIEMPG